MGYSENEWWPIFSNWDGYRRSVDKTLEWRLALPEETKDNTIWHGLKFLPCPFTGKQPTIKYGGYVGAAPYQGNQIWLECGIVKIYGGQSAQRLEDIWNTRV